MTRLTKLSVLLAALTALSSCDDAEYAAVTCSGKCDGIGFTEIKKAWRNRDDMQVHDLVNIGAGYSTQALNNQLKFSYGRIKIGSPKLYANAGSALLDQGSQEVGTVSNIDELVTNLAARYGASDLTTEVNQARADLLRTSDAEVFAESSFRVTADLNHKWNIDSGFEDGTAKIGFGPTADLESRVISAFDNATKASGDVVLEAMQTSRGFSLPRSIEDIRNMKSGESFALSGKGTLGINVGLNVPFVIAQPIATLVYEWVVSAHWGMRVEGDIDVQLVRLRGDEVVIDVGLRSGTVAYRSLGLKDHWGVQGLAESEISLGSFDVDLGKLLDRAVERRLNKKFELISASIGSSEKTNRISLSRLRFHLDKGNPEEIDQAVAQALRADVRLAQALAYKGSPGVISEFDLLRTGASATSYAGIDIFGLSFFKEKLEAEGSVVIQTPGGALSLLWESLHKESGFFHSRHGYTRIGIAGQIYDGSDDPFDETNLVVQITESDKHMPVNKALDHADALLVALAGRTAYQHIEASGNSLARAIWGECNPEADDPSTPGEREFKGDQCVVDFIQRTDIQSVVDRAVSDFEDRLPTYLNADQRALLIDVAKFRMSASAVVDSGDFYDHPSPTDGPTASIVVDFRFDDNALRILQKNGTATMLEDRVMEYLETVAIIRVNSEESISEHRASQEAMFGDIAQSMGHAFRVFQTSYRALSTVQDEVSIEGIGRIGSRAVEINVPQANDAILYEMATARSIARARSEQATLLFDRLYNFADELNDVFDIEFPDRSINQHPEQTVAYSLMSMIPAQSLDLRVNTQVDTSDSFGTKRERYRAAGFKSSDRHAVGENVQLIDGGIFNIDSFFRVD